MPEALSSVIPANCVPAGDSSEADGNGSNTARSTDDAVSNAETQAIDSPSLEQFPRKSNASHSQNQKIRKSRGRRSQKKAPLLKTNSQQKTSAAHILKSQIPRPSQQGRPLITPSSSTSSLSVLSTTASSTHPATPRPPPRGLLRQNSTQRMHFRLRKSISQMDFKQSRRSGDYLSPSIPGRALDTRIQVGPNQEGEVDRGVGNNITNMCDIVNNNNHSNVCRKVCTPISSATVTPIKKTASPLLTPITSATKPSSPHLRNGGLVVTQSHTALVQKMFPQNEYYYVLEDRNPKMAGMRVFATIMLNAWRKRRDEVKRLTDEKADLKRGSIKAKNQLHVFNTLFRVEQKRNGDLSAQLKRCLEEKNQTKSSCKALTASLISLEDNKSCLEQQFKAKEQELEALNTILSETQSELFKAMTQQRELQADMSMAQRKVQLLENQKNELINEVCDLKKETIQNEEKLQEQIQAKTEELEAAAEETKQIEELLVKLTEYELMADEFFSNEAKYKADIEALRSEALYLKQSLANTLACRVKACWQQSGAYQKTTLKVMHWVAYYILPAAPPPKPPTFPFTFTLQKALSIIKR